MAERIALAALLSVAWGCASTSAGEGAPLQPRGRWYTVGAPEVVADLARRKGVALEDIEELNGLDRRDSLQAGQRIFLPQAASRRRLAAQDHQRPSTTNGTSPDNVERLLWPVPHGRLSSPFGSRSGKAHEGIDIAAEAGVPVIAAADGEVIYAGSGVKGYGNLVIVRHAGNIVTVYAHNKRNFVREGQKVRRGEVLAEVGQSGHATGPHLHFEVRRGEDPQDPLSYVQPPR